MFPETGIQKPEKDLKLDVILKNRYRKTGILSETIVIIPEKRFRPC